MVADRSSVGGTPEARTEVWSTLARELGDTSADAVCAWADLCSDPQGAAETAVAVLRLTGPGQDAALAVNEHMLNVDPAAYLRAWAAANG